ncbi:MAG: hypothetical protein QOD74_1180 [Variibacter sp.]|jgi:hypothetical protein|nr:hypothetical protein [Variibacter sp.]
MPRGGSKPGEHRGGRAPGTPNKATLERLLRAERDATQADGRKLAKEVFEDFMGLFAGIAAFYQPLAPGQPTPAGRRPDESKFEKYARLAVGTAADLAPYQSPAFKAIAVMTPQLRRTRTGRSSGSGTRSRWTRPIRSRCRASTASSCRGSSGSSPGGGSVTAPADYDWKNPDHGAVMRGRLVRSG